MKKVVRLSESDLVRIVRRIVSEQINMTQEELPKNKVADDVEYWLDEYKNDMDFMKINLKTTVLFFPLQMHG